MHEKMPEARIALWGLLTRKPRWSLSRRGWMLILGMVTAFAATVVLGIHSFLAVNQPVQAEILIVEGWVADYAINVTVEEFRVGRYKRVLTTGGPVRSWRYAARFGGTYAGYAAH